MNDRLLIGTKKGLFELRRSRGEWSIAATRFLGDPISMLHDEADGVNNLALTVAAASFMETRPAKALALLRRVNPPTLRAKIGRENARRLFASTIR